MIAVCIKWIGATLPAGVSDADQAALEMALRQAETTGTTVLVVTAGEAESERGLRAALACGASTAVRVDMPAEADSATVAQGLAPVVAGASAVWCGDASYDRGSGSVPGFLAAALDWQQALGLIAVDLGPPVRATRRLDGGRREILRVTGPAVMSVEGSIARLRRAALRPALQSLSTEVLSVLPYRTPTTTAAPARVRPYRPRPRVIPVPVGGSLDRIRALTESSTQRHGETLHPESAAQASRRILEALRDWGYLDADR